MVYPGSRYLCPILDSNCGAILHWTLEGNSRQAMPSFLSSQRILLSGSSNSRKKALKVELTNEYFIS